MKTGASCVCEIGGVTKECNSAECRFVKGIEHIFKANVKFCIDNNIYVIANFDNWRATGHEPFNLSRLNDMMTIMYECGCNKLNSRITVENEPMKYITKEVYANQINQVYEHVAGRFYVGAGNEEFGLAGARGNMYQYILNNCNFDYLDIHIQSTMIDSSTWRVVSGRVDHYLGLSVQWAKTYGKKLSCTEANWSKIKTAEGHADLMMERDKAKVAGCEDFCIVFINGFNSKYNWLSYLWEGNQNSIYWNNLKNKMLEEKEEVIMAYLRPIIQQEFYDAMGWGTKPYHDNTPSLPIVGRKDTNTAIKWSDFDAVIETILKGIISGLKENGALPEAFPEPMNIKYNIDGSWNNDWESIAKERIK